MHKEAALCGLKSSIDLELFSLIIIYGFQIPWRKFCFQSTQIIKIGG